MKRKITEELLRWKNNTDHKPLVLKVVQLDISFDLAEARCDPKM